MQAQSRNERGQSLVGGTCGIILMVLFFGLVATFGLNSFAYGSMRAKLQIAADETANKVNRNIYWNGALRPLFQRNQHDRIAAEATDFGKAIARELGLDPALVTVSIDSEGVDGCSQVTLSLAQFQVPFGFAGVTPKPLSITATAISSEGSEPPPAFIRLGYNLIHGDGITPENTTTATQVCILPSYGFETDIKTPSGKPNVGGSDNNEDVVADQPDDKLCAWNALNVDWKSPTNHTPRFLGDAPRKKMYTSDEYVSLFGGER